MERLSFPACGEANGCGIREDDGGTSLLVVYGDAQGCVRSRFCALLLSCVSRKQDNGPPSGGLRRFSKKCKKNMTIQQTRSGCGPEMENGTLGIKKIPGIIRDETR